MNEQEQQVPELNPEAAGLDERAMLRQRLATMGINPSPNTGLDKLRKMLTDALNGDKPADPKEDGPTLDKERDETRGQMAARLRREASVQKRVRITCMNPNKREHQGELFTVSNNFVGTFKKFVPFDTPWHVPDIILKQIRSREYQTFVTKKAPNGAKIRVGKLVKEFAIEELPPLTEEELKDLAAQQAVNQSIDQ